MDPLVADEADEGDDGERGDRDERSAGPAALASATERNEERAETDGEKARAREVELRDGDGLIAWRVTF